MRKILILAAFFFQTAILIAANRDELSVSLIPDSMIRKAHSVVRSSETTITISGVSQMDYEVHEIITLLDEAAADKLNDAHYYNQFQKITGFNISIYDQNGKLMNKHSLKDMDDYAMYGGYTLFSDARIKYIVTNGGQYPITIDRTVSYRYNGFMSIPDWTIQGANESVEAASLRLIVPLTFDVHFKNYNISLTPSVVVDKVKTYSWSVKGLNGHKSFAGPYGEHYYCPHIDISPVQFEIGGHKGSMNSWAAFGRSMTDMWQGKRKLSDTAAREIREMIKEAHTDRDKINILYSYLQKNFHYVSIQIGVGGWIPFDAAMVHTVKYGDCKALSNYMCAMLDVAGVRSNPVLINAGSHEHAIDTTFTANRFNHVIVCARAEGLPVWLECTSTAMPPGELGTFTESRYGLMLGDSVGVILATPASTPDSNLLILTTEIGLASTDKASYSSSIQLLGEYRSEAKSILLQGNDKDKNEFLFNDLHLKRPESFSIIDAKDSSAAISATIKGTITNIYDFRTGNKSFLASSFISAWYKNITASTDRKEDLMLGFPFCKKEKLIYHIDLSNTVSLPGDFDLDNTLIFFHRKAEKLADNTVTIHTILKFKTQTIHPDEIALLKESLQKISKYLQQKVILETK